MASGSTTRADEGVPDFKPGFADALMQGDAVATQGTVHACPPDCAPTMPCCGRTPFEVSRWDRMTLDPEKVTCVVAVPAGLPDPYEGVTCERAVAGVLNLVRWRMGPEEAAKRAVEAVRAFDARSLPVCDCGYLVALCQHSQPWRPADV